MFTENKFKTPLVAGGSIIFCQISGFDIIIMRQDKLARRIFQNDEVMPIAVYILEIVKLK